VLTSFSGRRPSQVEGELRGFIALLQSRDVRAYAEIGSREGDTFHEVMTALPAGARGLALDLPGGLWGNERTRSKLPEAVADLSRRGYDAAYLFADSQKLKTLREVESRGPFDAILIDGDHTYAGVTRDWKLYRNLAPLIGFHDIVGDDCTDKVTGSAVEVPRLWAEIKASGRKTLEFVEPDSKMGIGVVFND
jgi:hypothetical protein